MNSSEPPLGVGWKARSADIAEIGHLAVVCDMGRLGSNYQRIPWDTFAALTSKGRWKLRLLNEATTLQEPWPCDTSGRGAGRVGAGGLSAQNALLQ